MKHVEETKKNGLLIVLPNASIQDLQRFRKGILSVLSKVKIEGCENEFKEDLKAVYELLSHLQIEAPLTKSGSELTKEKFNVVLQP